MLNAEQVEAMQASSPPTDWSKFDQDVMVRTSGLPGQGALYDDKLHVRFFMKARIDPAASAEQNRPVYKDTPYVEIMMPGEKNNIVVEPVWERYVQRFPAHWAQFMAGVKDQMVGTPLKVAPFLTEAQIEELAYFKIRTLEQLADLADSSMTFMGARELKAAAQKYLQKVSSNEVLLKRIEELEAKIGQEAKPTVVSPRKSRLVEAADPD